MNNKTDIFENYPVPRALAVMAIPTIISQLITLIYNMADTYFLGKTGNPYMVAACSLVLTIYMLSVTFSNIYGTGGGSLLSRLLGIKDEQEAEKVSMVSVWMALATAALFSLLIMAFEDPLLTLLGASENTRDFAKQYLLFVVGIGGIPTVMSMTLSNLIRSVGYSKEAAFGMSMGGVLNIILDPIFMFVILPDGMQVTGAALATMISNIVSLAYFILVMIRIREHSVLKVSPRVGLPRAESMTSLFNVGIPAGVSVLFFDLASIVANNRMAGHGDIALAAYGIVVKVERLPLNVGIGICLGMVPLIAYNYSAGNRKRMDSVFNWARVTGFGFAVLCVILYRIFSHQIMAIFINDEETVALGTRFLQARCFATPFMFLCFNMVHYFNALGRGKTSFVLALIRQMIFNIPIMLLLNAVFGMYGLIWTQMTADICTVAVSYLIYWRFRKREGGSL